MPGIMQFLRITAVSSFLILLICLLFNSRNLVFHISLYTAMCAPALLNLITIIRYLFRNYLKQNRVR